MLLIPKNVMQIGEINPHIKIYMEDYVHTFLEREKEAEIYLVFGKKQEQDDILYYMIYGVEKKTDWDRGSFPYFKKYERIGTMEGSADHRIFRPLRADGILLEGYFVFYEMNEDMQSYMIAVREAVKTVAVEEKEDVLEAVRLRREQKKEEWNPQRAPALRKKTKASRALSAKPEKIKRAPGQKKNAQEWSFAGISRAGSLLLLTLLVVAGLASGERRTNRKTIGEILADMRRLSWGEEKLLPASSDLQEENIIIEEKAVTDTETEISDQETAEAEEEQMQTEETEMKIEGTDLNIEKTEDVRKAEGTLPEESVSEVETGNAQDKKEEASEAAQAIARPVTYVVKKGDSLAQIARRFYGNTSILAKICELNEIDNPDHIHPGQNLLLP